MDSSAVEIDGSVMEGVSTRTDSLFRGEMRGKPAVVPPVRHWANRASRRFWLTPLVFPPRCRFSAGRTDPQGVRGAQLHRRNRRQDRQDPGRKKHTGAQVS